MSALSSAFTHFIRNLLAPPGNICLTCGGKSRLVRDWPGICQRCAGGIPWINRPRCLYCGRAFGCPDCLRMEVRHRAFILNRSAVQYSDVMREWLAQYKYRGHERYAQLLIRMMSHALVQMEREISALHSGAGQPVSKMRWKPDMITFVPVSTTRLMERGFNQAQVLAEGLGQLHRLTVSPLLVRSAHTGKQSFKTRQERIESMRNVFAWNPEGLSFQDFRGLNMCIDSSQPLQRVMRILLIDDIYTTGSTINACAEVLQQAFIQQFSMQVEVYSLTWARS
ncbi:amidophosphoribosyltransferase [Paenibacillus sp. J23TS9]|uniref:ComF family protein n=1 Tax=Paenibacillus sp. J23TS9 TaxID=2807193 RepID=UPI001AFF3197|nr:ComF family protein [Paenibacillus sp. J23TS9]GIP28712.1 amidophosphoribosyltransferase [Paenibacillus sp. J23TS9]